jgi:hypothetical protein
VEAKTSIVCSDPRRGLGINFYEHAASNGGDSRTLVRG